MPYYPKEYALRELIQLYSFTGLKIVENNSDFDQNYNTGKHLNSKPSQQKELVHQTSPKPETKTSQKERKIEK